MVAGLDEQPAPAAEAADKYLAGEKERFQAADFFKAERQRRIKGDNVTGVHMVFSIHINLMNGAEAGKDNGAAAGCLEKEQSLAGEE
jgi:hypothetical protein